MKKIYLLIFFLAIARMGWSQAPCNIPCCQQSFPYEFCDKNGNVTVHCSTNPNDDPANGMPAKAFIPSCVNVDQMPDNALWQPTKAPPQPAVYVGDNAFDQSNQFVGDEESGAQAQQESDETLFDQIPSQQPVDPSTEPTLFPVMTPPGDEPTCGDEPICGDDPCGVEPDPNDYSGGDQDPQYIQDEQDWNDCEDGTGPNGSAHIDWEDCNQKHADWVSCESMIDARVAQWQQDESNYNKFEGAEAQYKADLTAWDNSANAYVQIFDQNQAGVDATQALNSWRAQCSPPIQSCPSNPPCCINVIMDDNSRDFQDVPAGTLAQTIGSGANTFLTCNPTSCGSSNMTILVNVTDQNLGDERLTDVTPTDPSQYGLHTVNVTGFYTGQNPPPTIPGYENYSFFDLMLHEIGHCLGLHHPDDLNSSCTNCYTANPFWVSTGGPNGTTNPTGFQTVMALNNNLPSSSAKLFSPLGLTSEDGCQFQKLYCNTCGGGSGTAPCAFDDGVIAPMQDEFNAEIYPNPSTGTVELSYDVADHSFVQVTVYDVLGRDVLNVYTGYQNPGPQSISLGTEALPSGHYVCRVTVGDRAAYVDFIIKK